MLRKIQNCRAERRYRDTLAQYRIALEQNPALTLKSYCQMRHVYYRWLLGWMRKEGIKKPVHKASRGLKRGRVSASGSGLRYDKVLYSLACPCRLHGINFFGYLSDILTGPVS